MLVVEGGETTSVATSVWFVVTRSQLDMVLQITKQNQEFV